MITLGLGLASYYNRLTNSPLVVKTDSPPSQAPLVDHSTPSNNTAWDSNTQLRFLFIPNANHPQDTKDLLVAFGQHHPTIHIYPTQNHADADFVFGDISHYTPAQTPQFYLEPFYYALDNGKTVVAYANKHSLSAITFRDFMLSSIAQDIFIIQGFQSIEPYRNTDTTKILPIKK